MNNSAVDPRVTDIIKAGVIQLALFLPQYSKTSDGRLTPHGAGVVGRGLIGALAEQLGIEMQINEQPSPPEAIKTLNAGGCDLLILGVADSREKLVDFTLPVIQFDFAYLVPENSTLTETEEVDRPGCRISVPSGHASWMALKRSIEHAEIVGTDIPDEAFALVRDGEVDVFALPREQLIDYAEMLPGSRILAEGFGYNIGSFAVAKGRDPLLAFISDFVEEAKTSGLVKRILDEAELTSRGFDVA
jgi:polar amino acid transport system substrate-binding protein